MISALERHPEFQAFAMPKRFAAPIFSRYEPGMEYGDHVDSSIIGGVRTDLAMTLFLSPPASYEGGEFRWAFPKVSPRTGFIARDGNAMMPLAGGLRR